ncbi:MAG: SDR family oxidoreductase [Parcubacteria group bacterium]
MKKILLTGHAGNLGTHIQKYNTDNDIFLLGRQDWEKLDILLPKVDIVMHTAYDLKNKIEDVPSAIMESNILTTTRLLEAVKKHKIPQFVFISSCAVYGESMKTNEETERRPVSINGVTKLLNEQIIETFCNYNKIDFKIYRVFNMYGGRDDFSILFKLKSAILNNAEFNLNNNGIGYRDFIHVEDAAKVILMLMKTNNPFQYLNIGTGLATKIIDIIELIKNKYPNLKIKKTFISEAEYSRANILKLNSIAQYKFMSILDYIASNF